MLTASSDKSARLWDVNTGKCLKVLEGHTDEVFSCAFNYDGDIILTGQPIATPFSPFLIRPTHHRWQRQLLPALAMTRVVVIC